jgi:hypothetical protein
MSTPPTNGSPTSVLNLDLHPSGSASSVSRPPTCTSVKNRFRSTPDKNIFCVFSGRLADLRFEQLVFNSQPTTPITRAFAYPAMHAISRIQERLGNGRVYRLSSARHCKHGTLGSPLATLGGIVPSTRAGEQRAWFAWGVAVRDGAHVKIAYLIKGS